MLKTLLLCGALALARANSRVVIYSDYSTYDNTSETYWYNNIGSNYGSSSFSYDNTEKLYYADFLFGEFPYVYYDSDNNLYALSYADDLMLVKDTDDEIGNYLGTHPVNTHAGAVALLGGVSNRSFSVSSNYMSEDRIINQQGDTQTYNYFTQTIEFPSLLDRYTSNTMYAYFQLYGNGEPYLNNLSYTDNGQSYWFNIHVKGYGFSRITTIVEHFGNEGIGDSYGNSIGTNHYVFTQEYTDNTYDDGDGFVTYRDINYSVHIPSNPSYDFRNFPISFTEDNTIDWFHVTLIGYLYSESTAYQDGYDTGYNDGVGDGYSSGFDDGYDNGYTQGYGQGQYDGTNFTTLLFSIADVPLYYLKSLFNIELFGVKIYTAVFGLLTFCVVTWLIRRVI